MARNSGPSLTRLVATLAALVFALGSLAWSGVSLRNWWVEQQETRVTPSAWRNRRSAEPPDTPPSHPTNAWHSFERRRPVAAMERASELYTGSDVWTVHLRFTPEQWAGIEPQFVEPLERGRNFGGRFELRNPAARRSGLSGVRGLEFDWVHGVVEFEDRVFSDAAVRYKGNGTYLRSQGSAKRPFKVDLNKFVPGQSLAGRTTLNFGNLVADDSCLHDALGYEVYRAAGVPAPRTAFARLFLTPGTDAPQFLGLYVMVENLDARFAEERFGTRAGAIFKPVTTELFQDLGDDWAAYEPIYDPKTRVTPAQTERVIGMARLLTHADDGTFAARVGDYLDLDAFAQYLAVTVLLSSYDGFLTNGQNFYLWLDAGTGRFHFMPWDLDNAWGRFGMVGSASDRARASIVQPWVGSHRLLERVTVLPEFQARYRSALSNLLETVFLPERLHRRVDELAALLRPVVSEESGRRSTRFEQAVTRTSLDAASEGDSGFGRSRSVHPLKGFITERAASVRAQLSGEEPGVVLERWR